MSVLSELLQANARYAALLDQPDCGPRPRKRLAVLACMDTRLNPNLALDLREGDAHIIRNAGGLATDDALRSLIISQQGLGTREVVVIQHTDCGLMYLKNEEFRATLNDRFGVDASHLDFLPLTDLAESIRSTVAAIRACPFVAPEVTITGLMYDVHTRRLQVVASSPGSETAVSTA